MTGETPEGSRRRLLEHAQTVAEHTDRHAITLESLLAILRSSRLDDYAARTAATEAATTALIQLRTASDEQRSALLEPVTDAFSRLRSDLRPLVRFGDVDLQLVEPPATGRALPGEVAQGARAIVRAVVLTLVDRGDASRVRIEWDCDGLHLLMSIRDDGSGELSTRDDALRPIAERVTALDGTFSVTSTPGWGTSMDVVLPLDPRPALSPISEKVALTNREQDVLHLVATGARNHAIAVQLRVSENTVKFHVSNLLRKTGTTSRAELAGLAASR